MSEHDRPTPEGLEPSVTDLVEGAVRKLVSAIVIAGGLIAIGLYWQPSPRYQAFAADGRIYRVNTRSGTVIACQDRHCAIVVENGQNLEDIRSLPPQPRQIAPPAPAPVPAPTTQPAPAPATH